jgi:tRNA A-37 threonylcarbamoyl transferase component Bud32
MCKKDYLAAPWRALFSEQGLADFEALWNLSLDSIDEANFRGCGWSQVSLLSLRAAEGVNVKMIVKRQVNYLKRTPAHPISGIPTLKSEFANIQRCRQWDIPTMHAVYYAERRDSREYRAILITEYLEGYVSLDDLARQLKQKGRRTEAIKAVACVLKKLHEHRLRHGHLHPKHILVNPAPGELDVRLIDLECMYQTLTVGQCNVTDLSTLDRRLKHCHNSERMRFLHTYTGLDHLDRAAKRLCRRILKRTQKKKA